MILPSVIHNLGKMDLQLGSLDERSEMLHVFHTVTRRDRVIVDGVDHANLGATDGTAVPQIHFAKFTGWRWRRLATPDKGHEAVAVPE